MMIEFEDHSEESQRRLLECLDREETNSSRLTCPYCGAVNLFPWVPNVMAYTCRKSGQAVGAPRVSGEAARYTAKTTPSR
jgi:hypothetical protein